MCVPRRSVISTMPDVFEPLQYAFMQRALVGSVLVGIVCAGVGVFVVLRGLAFLGDAVAHAAFPGVVIAFLLEINLVIGGMIAAVLAAITMGTLARRSVIREDTAIGVVFSGMFALGIVLFSGITSYTGDLLGILFGNVLGVTAVQLALAAVATVVVVAVLRVWGREFIFVSFDPVGAQAAGLSSVRYDTALMGLIGVTVAVSVQVVGIVLAVAMLVTPAATARLLARDMRTFIALSGVFAVAASVIGLWVSYFANASSGGTIVLVATAEFALVWAATQLRR